MGRPARRGLRPLACLRYCLDRGPGSLLGEGLGLLPIERLDCRHVLRALSFFFIGGMAGLTGISFSARHARQQQLRLGPLPFQDRLGYPAGCGVAGLSAE